MCTDCLSLINCYYTLSFYFKVLYCKLLLFTGVRHLYTADALGIEGYLSARKWTGDRFSAESKQKLLIKMQEYVGRDSKLQVFTDEVKSLVHLVNSAEHIELVSQVTAK